MSYYRTFLNRYNYVDANIPGNDFQFPVSIEGVLGYNNAIQLTQPMHMQDLKYFRDPLWSYGDWVSSGETSKCTAFTDNPGNTANWNNTYEQYIAREAWEAYKVHGGNTGDPRELRQLRRVRHQGPARQVRHQQQRPDRLRLGRADRQRRRRGRAAFYNSAPQERTETAFWYSGARAAAEAYALLGRQAKADEMNAIADRIRTAILTLLWDDGPVDGGGERTGAVGPRAGQVRQRGAPRRRRAVRHAAGRPRHRRQRLHGLGLGQPGRQPDLVAGLRLRHRHDAKYVLDGQRRRSRRRATRSRPAAAGPSSGSPTTARCRSTSGATSRSRSAGPPGGCTSTAPSVATNDEHDAAAVEPGGHDPELDRPLAVRRPGTERDRRRLPVLRPRAVGARRSRRCRRRRGAGNVASYRFDEESGNTAIDSSPNARNATLASLVFRNEGKVFKQRDITRDALVPWKDQQNFSPFTEGVVPNTDNYKLALRYYADKAEFPIMPSYTANQRDKADATASGRGGSNNFSNINSTLQAQLYSKAPSASTRRSTSRRTCCASCSSGSPSRSTSTVTTATRTTTSSSSTTTTRRKTFGRSGIHHNILGAFNTMILDDIVGIRPRLDDTVELWPIDVGWDHYAVNHLSYHGADMTIVFDRAGDGRVVLPASRACRCTSTASRVLTVDDTARVSWNSATGEGRVLDGSSATVRFARAESPDRGARGRPGSETPASPTCSRRPASTCRRRGRTSRTSRRAGRSARRSRPRRPRCRPRRPSTRSTASRSAACRCRSAATSRATRSGAPRARRTPRTGSRSTSAPCDRSTR